MRKLLTYFQFCALGRLRHSARTLHFGLTICPSLSLFLSLSLSLSRYVLTYYLDVLTFHLTSFCSEYLHGLSDVTYRAYYLGISFYILT